MNVLTTVPVFPLPDYFLFPGNLAPLHIFEERYRQMIGDLMDQAGRLVMASIPSRWTPTPGTPPRLHTHGCLAEIMKHERLPDGRYLLLLAGLSRVRLTEVPSERLYRLVEAEPLDEIACSAEEEASLRPHLESAIQQRGGQRLELPQQLSVGALADILLQLLKLPPERMETMIAEPSGAARAHAALAWQAEGEA